MAVPRWMPIAGLATAGWVWLAAPGRAQVPDRPVSREEAIAQRLTSPVPDLLILPLQLDLEAGLGALGGTRTTLHVKPTLPFMAWPGWVLVTQTDLPLIHQRDVGPLAGTQLGLGDLQSVELVTPLAPTPRGLRWGIGVVFHLATATDPLLGAGKWALGPAVLVRHQARPVSCGLLAFNMVSVAGDAARPDLNMTSLQPYVSLVGDRGWTLDLRSESRFSWTSAQWTVPLELSVGQVLGAGHGSLGASFLYTLVGTAGAPRWVFQLKATPVFLP